MTNSAAEATAAYYAAVADGPFDHQRDAYEQGWEDGAIAERQRIAQELLAEADRGAKTGLDRIALRAFAHQLLEPAQASST